MGQSLFEAVIAIGFISLVIVAVAGLTTVSLHNSTSIKNKARANSLASEGIDFIRSRRDAGFEDFYDEVNVSPFRFCMTRLSFSNTGACTDDPRDYIDGIFFRDVIFETTDTDPVQIPLPEFTATVVVSWTDNKGTHESRATTIFSDWRAQ